MTESAVSAIKRLNEAGRHAFITCESCGPEKLYQVVCKFKTMEQSHEFHSALIECGEAAAEILAEESAYSAELRHKIP